MQRTVIVGMSLVLAGLVSVRAQEGPDRDVLWKIRQEGADNSQILQTLHVLTDVYGPRLTGSPNLKAAGEWALKEMGRWGLRNGHLEPWDFGRPGWVNERLTAHIVAPVKDALVAEALVWTPGTSGAVRGQAQPITLPQRPTREQLAAALDPLQDAVKGKIVLIGPPRRVLVSFNAPPLRREDADVLAQLDRAPAGGPATPAQRQQPARQQPAPLTNRELQAQLNEFLVASGALVRVNDAGRDHGQIRAFNNTTFDVTKAPPTVVMRNEDYGRIWRLVDGGRPVELELELDIVNQLYPDGKTSCDVIAEIPGTDKADEVVMLGGHLDSWHAATGATDNAVGCAVMMEAARILAAVGVKPRRTIRVALWSGEEQGLLGSQAYVKEHFGTFEEPKPEFAKFAGYFNIDNGTGRARALTVFGPPAAGQVLRDAVTSLGDLGVLGATRTRSRRRGGTDYTSFNAAGLPGIGVTQDPIQYRSYTWHTNLDTYERIVEDDVKKSAIAIAAIVYHIATREELLPRFTKDDMPPPPRPPRARSQPQPTQSPAPSGND